jgi:hypothetical protein
MHHNHPPDNGGFLYWREPNMSNLTSALGHNASSYEAIALKVVDLIDAAEVSLEVGIIALKTAQLILDARQRDAWDAVWVELKQTNFALESEASPEMQHVAQV